MVYSAIHISNLRKSYVPSQQVLNIPSVEFRTGQLTCVLGPTGCGKTTLLNILAGADSDFQGEVIHVGVPTPRISYQPQNDVLLPWKTVRDNLMLGFIATHQKPPTDLTDRWLRVLDLVHVADAYPTTLSSGMRQRAALGRALIWNGDLKLLDEPLSAQDFSRRLSLEALLRDELRKPDAVAIVVTHNLEEAVVLGDRIIVLGDQPAEILADFEVTGLPPTNRPLAARRAPEFANYVSRAAKALSGAPESK